MTGKFVGVKCITGTSKKDGKPYSFSIACIVTDYSEKDINDFSAVGENVHSVPVPDHFTDILNLKNVGKSGEFEFYYAGRGEQLAYVRLDDKSK